MQIHAQVLAGSTKRVPTGKGEREKSQLKVMDIGPEAAGGDVYWLDLWAEAALTEQELERVKRQQVVIEVRRVAAKASGGRAFLNMSGGAVLLNGEIVQRALRGPATKSA